jgi:SAM-dependent methyltransferase
MIAPTASSPSCPDFSLLTVQTLFGRHIPLYRRHLPTYQLALLQSMRQLWNPAHKRLLDVGGGTGIIAQAMKELFAIPHVTSVDVHDRYLETLDIETRVYGGDKLPFPDVSFDSITFSNVMHHVPIPVRAGLMRECARVVGGGPIYIKDHVAASRLDHARLFALDAMGNIPFGGMVKADYLTQPEWEKLAADCGYRIETQVSGQYRDGPFALAFPNRLETTMRLVRVG